jgi:hypothetical protein
VTGTAQRVSAAADARVVAAMNRARGGPGRRGWYEVYYVTTALGDGRAAWLRWTLLSPRRGDASTAVWACAFDRAQPRWFAARNTFSGDAWHPLEGGGVVIGDAQVSAGGCRGGASDSEGRRMRWALEWQPAAEPFPFFPAPLERLAGSATYPIVTVPFARATGYVEVDGVRIECQGTPAQQSHLFGGRHAHRWGWVHALGFDDDPDGYLSLVWARPARLGGRTPPVSSIALRVAGRDLRAGGVRGLRRVLWGDGGGELVHFSARLDDVDVEGEVVVPTSSLTGVTYHDPDGAEVFCANTEVADLRLRLRDRGGAVTTVTCLAACGFERGARTPQPGIWQPL